MSLLERFFKIQIKNNYLAQSLFPPGRFQKETVTDFPLIQRQFLLSTWSLWTPNQYWPLGSPLWRLHSSQERKPCKAGLDSSTKEPSLSSQKSEKYYFFLMKIFKNPLNTKVRWNEYIEIVKTRTKVVHKNGSQGCHQIRKIESKKVTQPLHG